jgi:hypothetical protein
MFDRADCIGLDVDSSESPVHRQQEGSAYNGGRESRTCTTRATGSGRLGLTRRSWYECQLLAQEQVLRGQNCERDVTTTPASVQTSNRRRRSVESHEGRRRGMAPICLLAGLITLLLTRHLPASIDGRIQYLRSTAAGRAPPRRRQCVPRIAQCPGFTGTGVRIHSRAIIVCAASAASPLSRSACCTPSSSISAPVNSAPIEDPPRTASM